MPTSTSKDIFLASCQTITSHFKKYGFKEIKNGQTAKKTAGNKDLTFEIKFESSSKNNDQDISFRAFISISSKAVGQWYKEKYPHMTGHTSVFGSQLGYLTESQNWKTWNLASDAKKVEKEVIQFLEKFALPIFEKFEDIPATVEFIAKNGTQFYPHMEKDNLVPLEFMLCHGSPRQAQSFLDVYLKNCKSPENVRRYVKSLEKKQEPPPETATLLGKHLFKIAWEQGLKF